MSNLAYARPQRRPVEEQHPRHVEVVPTREQKRARPRVMYAVTTIASLFVIFAAQLLLSIVVSDGAYQIDALQAQQKDLVRQQEALNERLDLLGSNQHLAANAASIGMVPGASPLFLDISSGGVAAAPGTIDRAGCGGSCNLVLNSLLTGIPLVSPQAPATPGAATSPTAPVAPAAPTTTTTGPVDALPAPVTH